MPRLKVPETIRMKAIRSRCCGSMLAWTLNTKPVTSSRVGLDRPVARRLRARRRGEAGDRLDQLGDAEVLERRAEIDRGQVAVAIGLEVELGIAGLRQLDLLGHLGGQLGIGVAPAEELLARPFGPADRAAGEVEHALELPAHPDRPALGLTSSASMSATSSSSSNGDRPSRSTLLTKVMIGTERSRQTSNSLRVCGSMPLAASITMTAESTAVSVR